MSTSNNPNSEQILSVFESWMESLTTATTQSSRASAEQKLSSAKNDNLLLYLECLLQLTLKSKNDGIKQLSIVMFRQSVQPNNTSPEQWDKIPSSAFSAFETALLSALKSEKQQSTYILLCDAIGTLASRVIPKGHWQNLLSVLLELANEPNSFHKQGFLRVLDCLAEYSIDHLKDNFANIYKVIVAALTDKDVNVTLTAFKAYVSIIVSLDNMDELNKWRDVIPNCLNLLNIKNEEILCQILSSFIDVISHRFILIKPMLNDLIICLVTIAKNDSFQFDCRKLAFESLVVMTTNPNNASLLRANKAYMQNVVELVLYFLSCYDEEISFNSKEEDAEQLFIWNARQWIDDLALKLGGKSFLNYAQNHIKNGLESSQWKQCYASLQALIQIIKHCKDMKGWNLTKITEEENKQNKNEDDCLWDILLPKILKMCVSNNVRPEIKHSALFLIKTLINVYEKAFCDRYFLSFYSTMIRILQNYKNENLRVMEQCVKCISHFHKDANSKQIEDKSQIILKSLSLIVNDSKIDNKLKAHSITAIGTCADVMKSHFLPYYDRFMPMMMNVISNNKLDQILRGKAMESIGMIGEAVGNARFGADAHKLMQILLPFRDELAQKENEERTAYNYINQLFARISRCIGDSFVQYFPKVIPQIIESASIEAAQVCLPDEATPSDDRFSVFTVHLRGIGDTKFCINPISLDEKQIACHMLYQFAKDQCVGFFPFVLETAKTMKSLMRYQYNAKVRAAATTIVPLLLKSIIKGMKVMNNGKDVNAYKAVFNELFEPFMEALLLEPDVVETVPILEILGQIASVISQSNGFWTFDRKQLLSIAETLEAILTESQSRTKQRIDDQSGDKLIVDEQTKNDILWANEVEIELIAHIIDCIEYTLKCSGDLFIACLEEKGFGNAAKLILTKDKKYQSDEEILQALCIFIDCIELGGKLAAEKYLKWFWPILSQYAKHSDDDIKQTAIFGIGILAKLGLLKECDPNYLWFDTLLKGVQEFKQNEEIKEAQNAFGDDEDEISKYLIYENMVSAVGKIIRYQPPNNMNVQQMLSNWIRLLPIENDQEEFNSVVDNLLFFMKEFWNELVVKSEEMRGRILFCCLYYLSQFRDSVTSYELIMDYDGIDLNDKLPTNVPVLSKENILKIKQLKENPYLVKMKAFEKVMEKMQPSEIQNIQTTVNRY